MDKVELVYLSGGAKIGDGMRITRVWTDDQGQQHFAIMVDPKTERFSEVVPKRISAPPTNTPPTLAPGNLTATVEAPK